MDRFPGLRLIQLITTGTLQKVASGYDKLRCIVNLVGNATRAAEETVRILRELEG
ncbi:hypothetical protein [Corynebacterium wankanglinii]|uniref:Uncharacterized protein n=1 Tax=Corynebacterium wankanglinii TaxID=2735136 RepID=A0A838CGX2_9CORY|nr:hypothetical protein [Corynebacterium wankanglinii]MBA1834328.1 hypothetical protein [Corynebacterium wankanglinii]